MAKTLGMKIRDLRMKKGLTQTDLAEGLVTPSMISQIEADKANPSYKLLEALAKRLDVSIDYFLNDIQEKLELDSRYKLARAMIQSQDYEKAIEILQELLQYPGMQTFEVKFDLAEAYVKNEDYERAEDLLDALYHEVSLDKDRRLVVQVLDQLAFCKIKRKDYILARHFLLQAFRESKRLDESDRVLKGKVLRKLADTTAFLGPYEDAIEYYEDALTALQGTTELFEMGKTYEGLGDIFGKLEEFRKAADYTRSAITMFKSAHCLSHVGACMTKLGYYLGRLGDYEEAERIYKEVLEEAQERQDREQSGYVLARLGELYALMGEYEQALDLCQQGLAMIPETSGSKGPVLEILGRIAWQMKAAELAVSSLTQAADRFEQENLYSELIQVHTQLSQIYQMQGDLEAANTAMLQATRAMEESLKLKGLYL
jgi:tetratricopeptide (TPR) repeat protein